MTRPSLRELQGRFAALVAQPAPLEEAARALANVDPGVLPFARWTARTEGLAVYAGMYFARLSEVLRAEFERVARVAGAAGFDLLIADYLARTPPESPSLRDLGGRFADFVSDHAVGRERTDLADLARLERARADVVDAADAILLDRRTLARMPSEDWPTMILRLAPSVRVLELEHAVDHVWLAADRGEAIPEPRRVPSTVLVWRLDFVARHRAVDGDERAALRRISDAVPFEQVCEAMSGDDSPERSAANAHARLEQWLVDGILCR